MRSILLGLALAVAAFGDALTVRVDLEKSYDAFKASFGLDNEKDVLTPAEVDEMEKILLTLEKDAFLLAEDPTADSETLYAAGYYGAMPYLDAVDWDEKRFLPLLKKVSAKAVAALPGSAFAELFEYTLTIFEAPKGKAAFLDRVREFQKTYPKGDSGAYLIDHRTRLMAGDDRSAAKDFLKEASAIYPGNSLLALTHDILDRLGKPFYILGTSTTGSKIDTRDWKGKVVLVDFWKSHNAASVHHLPAVLKLYEEFQKDGLEVVGVSYDLDKIDLEEFTAKQKVSWPQVFFPTYEERLDFQDKHGVFALPTVFLIDRKGNLVYDDMSDVDRETKVQKALSDALKRMTPNLSICNFY